MDTLQHFKNFNIGKEIDLAGTFAYNALTILNSERNIYQNDQIFMFLYNAAVSVERIQKCVLFLYGSYDLSDIDTFALELKIHSQPALQSKINVHTKKKLSEEQNALLDLLKNFYEQGRYSNFSISTSFDYKAEFEGFVKKHYDPALVETSIFSHDTYITEQAKERIGRTLGKLLCYYYELIKDKAREENLYTYELRSDSPAEKVFLNLFPKSSLQAVHESERNALAELILYLCTTTDSTGYFNYLRKIKPLPFDPFMVQEYLVDIMNRIIPQSLVDEVATIYENMSRSEVKDRKDAISIIGAHNISFPEDEDYLEEDEQDN